MSPAASDQLLALMRANQGGAVRGIPSLCTSNRFAIEAGIQQALRDRSPILVESTANQVNQFGGYSDMTPADYARHIRSLAKGAGLPSARLILGGDHLGPYVWRTEPADVAMEKAATLVQACVAAGYAKLHLDASMALPGDPPDGPDDEQIAARTARLCAAAEAASMDADRANDPPVYVIGAEVPIPGGAIAGQHAPRITSPSAVASTVAATERAFRTQGLDAAWDRVIAIVVQPGVEFGDLEVFDYAPDRAAGLTAYIEQAWPPAYEAHSTDYQTESALRQLVLDHFAILKVGPGLTFAVREALFALAAIETEHIARQGVTASLLRNVLDEQMLMAPEHWQPYYVGDPEATRFARDFSLSDRSRYYWDRPAVRAAVRRLLENLRRPGAMPLTLVSQYLPDAYDAVRDGLLRLDPHDLVVYRVRRIVERYARACGSGRDGQSTSIGAAD